ncbi:MAG: rhodanese-like domain-containing protein [Thermoanaerobaculia bacterium]
MIFPSTVDAEPARGFPVTARLLFFGSLVCGSAFLPGCLGTGTRRVDAACREMRSAVVFEMLKDNPTMHLIDLRKPAEVTEREARIPGAQLIPLEMLGAVSAQLQPLRDSTIVVFGVDGEMGRRGCQLLSARGFQYVIFISDGAVGWFRNGFPSARRPADVPAPIELPDPKRRE